MILNSANVPEVLNRPNELPVIKFHNKFLGPIVAGDKVSTIRRKPLPLKRDYVAKAVFKGTNFVLKIVIADLGTKKFRDLDSEDAYFEGYNHVDTLKRELLKIYPNLKSYDNVYYYRFAVVDGWRE